MTVLPFICLVAGLLLSLILKHDIVIKLVDRAVNIALIVLMITIGMNIGINDTVITKLGMIGINCVVISLCAIAGSVLCVVVLEKTVLPFDKICEKVSIGRLSDSSVELHDSDEVEENKSPLIWIMPVGIIVGILTGYFFLSSSTQRVLDCLLMISLVVLYTGVGFSMGQNRSVFQYVRKLGFRILLIPLAIFIGSAAGGLCATIICQETLQTAFMPACGMSYYSITGAFMTQTYGIEIGTYGFIVNVMREFFTIIFMPLLVKISKGSPIASGASGNMDTMLVPIIKFIGVELGVVALITGIVLTIVVPMLMPVIAMII